MAFRLIDKFKKWVCSDSPFSHSPKVEHILPTKEWPKIEPITSCSNDAYDHLVEFSVFSPNPYINAYGREAVGYGHVLQHGENYTGIKTTPKEAERILLNDIEIMQLRVCASTQLILTQGQFDAIVCYLLTVGECGQQIILNMLDRSELDKIPSVIASETYIGRRLSPVMVATRQDQVDLFLN